MGLRIGELFRGGIVSRPAQGLDFDWLSHIQVSLGAADEVEIPLDQATYSAIISLFPLEDPNKTTHRNGQLERMMERRQGSRRKQHFSSHHTDRDGDDFVE